MSPVSALATAARTGRPRTRTLRVCLVSDELPVTSDEVENVTDEITLKRDELDALIEDAVRKDRARR